VAERPKPTVEEVMRERFGDPEKVAKEAPKPKPSK
jgi:hypothetical protein